MSNVAIQVENLRVIRGKSEVLHGITVSVPKGQVTGLLGPSGSGKSTLIRSIVGVQKGVAGQITVLGKAAGHRQLERKLAYDTQSASVFDDLTVEQNLKFASKILGVGKAAITEAITRVDLAGYEKQLVGSLSGGQRNRVSLAVALLGKPDVLVLDEPTVGLDPVLRRDLWQLFNKLAGEGVTLLISSHVMDEAERCDSLILMREGEVIAQDTLANLLAKTGTSNAEAAFLAIVEGGSK